MCRNNEHRSQDSVCFVPVQMPVSTIHLWPSGIEGAVEPSSAEESFLGDGFVCGGGGGD